MLEEKAEKMILEGKAKRNKLQRRNLAQIFSTLSSPT